MRIPLPRALQEVNHAKLRRDMQQASERFASAPSRKLQSYFGTIEYAEQGSGSDILFSHGVLGSHLDGLQSADFWVGGDVHAVAPSRFGYFGSMLPASASLGDQANAYVELLDHLGIGRAVAIGFSAGGPSVIELALRHPDRVKGLVLCSSRLPGLPKPSRFMKPILHFVFGSDRLFWFYKQLLPKTYALMMGVPRSYEISDDDRDLFVSIASSFFPLRPRREGAMFDSFVSNPAVDTYLWSKAAYPR